MERDLCRVRSNDNGSYDLFYFTLHRCQLIPVKNTLK